MSDHPVAFSDLGLVPAVLKSIQELGYETPSPIQAQCIPVLLQGQDVLGMAQTGTGKTAAFALPALNRLDLSAKHPQVLVLTPTRELAIQVAEAFQVYARHLKGFHVLPVYGGQNFGLQLKQLKRGPQVIVGTPGRILDHLDRKTLNLGKIRTLVLDEADEMLRMGFIEDVERIMAATPAQERQTALFSATMPEQIRRITKSYMNDPQEVKIAAKTSTVKNIEQHFWRVNHIRKIDALSRILETEDYDGVIVFARTKTATVELAEKLEARGHASAALNGDMSQTLRERTVNRLKKGSLDIVIATDVAARGLDVERIDLVVNYDIPYDTEAYVHRIGRTGRAGRTGKAILFVAHRERHLLRAIEKATRQTISEMQLPSPEQVGEKRISDFRQRLVDVCASESMQFYQQLIEQFSADLNMSSAELAAALLYLAQQEKPLQPPEEPEPPKRRQDKPGNARAEKSRDKSRSDKSRPVKDNREHSNQSAEAPGQRRSKDHPEVEAWDLYRIEVGLNHQVQPKNIVGAIANEADLDSQYIGHIELFDNYSTVELPEGMPKSVLKLLQRARICGQPSAMHRIDSKGAKQSKKKMDTKTTVEKQPSASKAGGKKTAEKSKSPDKAGKAPHKRALKRPS